MLSLNLNQPSYRLFAGSNKNLKTGIPYASIEIQEEVIKAIQRLQDQGVELTGPSIAANATSYRSKQKRPMDRSTVYAVRKLWKQPTVNSFANSLNPIPTLYN